MNEELKPPLTTTTSLWPAAAVLGVAVVMLVVFMAINLLASSGVTKTTTTTLPIVVGGLQRDSSPGGALTYCRQTQEVPSNISDAFVMPLGTTALPGASTPNLGAGDFDCVEPLTTPRASAAALIAFYTTQLEARSWNLFSTSPSSNGDAQALFQKAGNDGFYWIVGITITTSTSRGSRWIFTIYQNSQTI